MVGSSERIEELLSYGGMKKDVVILAISAASLILSLFAPSDTFPFDPAWVAVVLCGTPILLESITGLLFRFDIKADVLVSIALVASLYIGEIFAAGEVAVIMAIGSLLEEYTSERAHRGISRLIDMRPETARVMRGDTESIIPAEDVRIGDVIKVLAGESVPVDGIISSGATSIDQSMITGESMPVDKTEGDEVMSGTMNRFGVFTMIATKITEDSSMERMIRLMEAADADKAPVVRVMDRWASWFVLISLLTSIITYFVTNDVVRAVTVLVVFCPCAFILATPTAVAAAIGNSSKHGILVKSGAVMENISRIDTVTFDKTGTLTYGEPSVSSVKSVSSLTDEEILRICATAEKESEHPLGRAIVRSYPGEIGVPEGFKMIPGKGVSCKVDGDEVLVGNDRLMTEMDVDMTPSDGMIDHDDTAVFVSVNGKLSGYIRLEDRIKEGCRSTITAIKDIGIRPILMTGDIGHTAKLLAEKAGIEDVIHDCLPEDKLENVRILQSEGSVVCMVGDGINDAPALKRADVGISMGSIGSDIAIEASDISLVNDDIERLPHLFLLSRKMMRTIAINIILSMTINITAIILAATGVLDPISGALVHNVGSVFVVVNSALLLGWKERSPEKGRSRSENGIETVPFTEGKSSLGLS